MEEKTAQACRQWPGSAGEMAGRIGMFDWNATPLGDREGWSDRLKGAVELMLAAPQIASLLVGPERILLYNDEAARHYGDRHPHALGRPIAETFAAEFPMVAAEYDRVFAGESRRVAAQELDLAQTSAPEVFDAYLVPVRDGEGRVIAASMTGFAVGARRRAEARLRESEERQGFLLALADRMRAEDDAEAIVASGSRMLGEWLGASRVVFAEIDEAAGVAHIRSGWTAVGTVAHPAQLRLTDFAGPLLDDLRAGRVVRYDDVGKPPFPREDLAALHAIGVRAGLGVPLIVGGRLTVNLNVHQDRPRRWTDAEIGLAGEVAERLWTAVQRARAEVALRDSQRLQSAMLGVLPLGLAVIRTDGQVALANPEWERFMPGARIPSADREQGWRWRAWHKDGRPVEPRDYPGARALRGERVVPGMDFLHTDARGRETWTSVAAVPLPGEDGRPIGAVSIVQDIDAAKRASEALRESEERLRRFGEASQDILWIRDAATMQWLYLSPGFETIYGIGREEALTGDDYRNWREMIVPADRDHAISSIERVRAGEQVAFEYRIRRPGDGTVRWLRDTDFPITNDAGEVVMFGGIGHDFTDARDAEQRHRTLVEGIPQLVWRAVDGGIWTWASPQWIEYTGQREAEYRDWGWLEAVHPDDRDKARQAWARAMDEGGFEVEYRIRRRSDGAYRWFQTRAAPVRDEAGGIVEWLGTSTDIDDLRRLQEQQRVLLAELQHRVRNVLAVTRSIISRSDDGQRSTDNYVRHLQGRISALARTQVLLTRKAGTGVDLEHLIREELLAQVASDDQFALDGPDVRLSPKAAEVLTLAVHELATNATKYGAFSRTEGRLHVRWSLEERAGRDWLVLDWAESGVPIVDAAPRRQGFGTELVARRIPYELKGRGRVDLRPGGLRSRIEFPLAAGDSIFQTDEVFQ